MEKIEPTFPMELEEKDLTDASRRRTSHLIRETLHETINDPTWVGKQGISVFARALQPHNCRLYFDFTRTSFNPTKAGFSLKNHDSEYHTKVLIKDCYLVVRKKTIEVINKKSAKKYWRLYATKNEDIDQRLSQLRDLYDYECIEALKELIRLYGGHSNQELLKRNKCDMKVKGDEYLDNIPKHLIIDDYPYFKKVYDKDTEIYGFENTRTYLRNKMLEDHYPVIAEEISELRKENNMLLFLKGQIKEVLDVYDYENDIRKLSSEDKLSLTDYLFELGDAI